MQSLEIAIEATWPRARWQGTRVLVAVSGGADSLALLHAILRLAATQPEQLERQIQVAHFNHGWRGAESDADEAFVCALCQRLNVPLIVGRAEHHHVAAASTSGGSLDLVSPPTKTEESARKLRYEFLTKTAHHYAARYVLTAHTANDRVETMLHNLFRGTGLSGVVGPSLHRSLGPELVLVRPLLGCWRGQIESYLQELGQDFRVDSSNADVTFQRNYLRQALLPELRERFGAQLDERLLAFSELAEETVAGLQELATQYLRQVDTLRVGQAKLHPAPNLENRSAIYLPIESQLAYPWPVVHQALVRIWQAQSWPLQAMSREHWERLRGLMSSANDEEYANLPGGLVARRVAEWVIVAS